MIRVLHIVESLDLGGAERVITDLVSNMPKSVESFVCCLKRTGEMANRLSSSIPVFELCAEDGNSLRIPFKISKIISHNTIDIVHGHNWNTFVETGIAAMIANETPVVHTIHGLYISHEKSIKGIVKKYLRIKVERWLAKKCCKICTVSGAIKNYSKPHLNVSSEKIPIIINGVEISNNKYKSIRKKLGINDTDLLLCFVGRVVKEKNLIYLFSIMPRFIKEFPTARLLIIGEGIERQSLEEYAQKNCFSDNVIFGGFQKEPMDYLLSSDIFVLPSLYEGISIAILEAMAAGLPTVVTDVGGNREVVQHNETGYIVSLNEPDLLLQNLISLASDEKLRKKFSVKARERVETRFNIQVTAQKYHSIYKECLGRRCYENE